MAVYNGTFADGFLLYKAPFRETESLCELFLAKIGKIRCRISGTPPQAYQPFELKLTKRRGFFSASDFRYIGPTLVKDHNAMLMGMYVNEVLVKVADYEIANHDLFAAYTTTLAYLEQGIDVQLAIREFEQVLLASVGHAVDYHSTTYNDKIDPLSSYNYRAQHGFVEDADGRYRGELINYVANKEFDQKGVLAIARECQQLELDALIGEQIIHSRTWAVVKSVKNKD